MGWGYQLGSALGWPGADARVTLSGMTRAAFVMVFLVIGCAEDVVPESLEPAPQAEVCGELGPVRLLALDPDERVGYSEAFVVAADRLLFVAGKVDGYAPAGIPLLAETRERSRDEGIEFGVSLEAASGKVAGTEDSAALVAPGSDK